MVPSAQPAFAPSEVEIELPPLWPHQERFIFDPARYTVCVSATKTGKSTACAWWMAHQMANTPDGMFWWIGPTFDMGILGYRNVQALLGPAMKEHVQRPYVTKCWNGSTLVLKTAQEPEHLRGAAVTAAVLDEAGTPTYDMAWPVIRTTISETKGRLKIIGNPGDRGGFFWRAVGYGKDETMPEWAYHQWNFLDRPTATQEELEEAKRELGEDSADYQRYYLGKFVDEDGAFFTKVLHTSTMQEQGPRVGASYMIGVDAAIKTDFFVASVLREDNNTQVAVSRHKGPPSRQQSMEVKRLSDKYNHAMVQVEVNGPGEAIYQDLIDLNVPVRPFNTTGKSKGEILHQLQKDIATGRLKLLNHPMQIHELEQFQCYRTKTGSLKYGAPMGEHDDTVMALALANNGLHKMISAEVMWV